MKIFCVTGAVDSDLALVKDMLAASGIHDAKPSRLDTGFTLAHWHAQVLSSTDDPAHLAGAPPGRLWEQLASSIFLENMSEPLWGWADRRSVWLLEFWRAFEPNLHFVLVSTSPQRAISEALCQDAQCDIAALMQAWMQHSRALLQFALRHPQRTLLVDAAQCEAAPAALIAACARHWQVALALSPGACLPARPDAPLADYLAQQLYHALPEAAALYNELAASLHPLATPVVPAAALQDAVRELRALRAMAAHSVTASQELARVRKEADGLGAEVQAATSQAAQLQKKCGAAQQEIRGLAAKLEAQQLLLAQERTELNADLHAAHTSLNEAQNEAENLLLQLRQVQGELEHYFFEYQSADLARKDMAIHRQRLLARNPTCCDYEAIDATVDSAAPGDRRVHWRITQFVSAGRTIPALTFDTVIAGGGLQFVFNPTEAAPSAGLLRWPAPAAAMPLTLAQDGAPAALATADVALLHTLCALLAHSMRCGEVTLDHALSEALSAALGQYANGLAGLPPVLRFDRVQLKREQINPDYEHLWLALDNISFGERRHPHFTFRLSCANVRPQQFGAHPKLEFPADGGRDALEAWFSESTDDFGPKLELRYALPEAMDVAVWNSLSARDHALLNQLIALLPLLLADLQQQKTSISRPWRDWEDMAGNLQRIHQACTGALPSNQESEAAANDGDAGQQAAAKVLE